MGETDAGFTGGCFCGRVSGAPKWVAHGHRRHAGTSG